MNREDAQELMRKLFSSFGKANAHKDMKTTYIDWTTYLDGALAETVIERVISEEDKFPTIAELNRVLRQFKRSKTDARWEDKPPEERCWYCDDTGLIPVLYKPNNKSSVPYVKMRACKCSFGDMAVTTRDKATPSMRRYFDRFPEPQFEDRKDDFPGLNYSQIVDAVQREMLGINVAEAEELEELPF